MHIYPERCYGWLVWIMSHVSVCYIAAINMRIGNRWDSSSDITHALLLHSSTPFSIWFHSNPTGLFVVKSAILWLYAISHSIWCPPILQFPQCEHYTHLFCCIFSSPWGRSEKPLPSSCLFFGSHFYCFVIKISKCSS